MRIFWKKKTVKNRLSVGESARGWGLRPPDLWVVRLVVTGGSLTRRPKRSLHCLLVEVPWQINEYLNLNPRCNFVITITALSTSFLALNAFHYLQKTTQNVLFLLLRTFSPIFHFKLCTFCWQEAQEYFLPQSAGYPSYATAEFWSEILLK